MTEAEAALLLAVESIRVRLWALSSLAELPAETLEAPPAPEPEFSDSWFEWAAKYYCWGDGPDERIALLGGRSDLASETVRIELEPEIEALAVRVKLQGLSTPALEHVLQLAREAAGGIVETAHAPIEPGKRDEARMLRLGRALMRYEAAATAFLDYSGGESKRTAHSRRLSVSEKEDILLGLLRTPQGQLAESDEALAQMDSRLGSRGTVNRILANTTNQEIRRLDKARRERPAQEVEDRKSTRRRGSEGVDFD